MSSLAQQLQGIASLDAARLTSKTGAPSSKSYLFSAAEAAEQDLDAIWAIGSEGFEQLCQLDPDMVEFEEELFAERTKRIDRMMLNKEDNAELDKVLERCLRRLGRWIGVLAGGKCIEWLIRRFRVHEMNVETLIQVFLPYHESQNFPRMLSILTVPPTSIYHAPFQPLIRTAQPVPRSYIVMAISPAKEPSLRLLRDVVGSVHLALQEGVAHRALLAFWSAAIIELLESGRNGKGIKEGVVIALVEAFVEVLSTSGAGQDVNAAVYPPLILLTRTVRLADEPFLAILSALLTPGTGAIGTQRILTLLVLLNDRKGWIGGLGDKAAEHLAQVKLLGDTLLAAMGKYGFENATGVVVGSMLDRPDLNIKHLRAILDNPSLPSPIVKAAALKLVSPNEERLTASSRPLLAALRERHPAIVDAAILESGAQVHLDSSLAGKIATGQTFADVYSADVATRISSIQRIFDTFTEEATAADRASAKEAIRARLADEDQPVVDAIYQQAGNKLETIMNVKEVVQAVRPSFVTGKPVGAVIKAHLRYLAVQARGEEDVVYRQLVFPCLLGTQNSAPLDADAWAILANGGLAADSVLVKIAQAVGQMEASKKSDVAELDCIVISAAARAVTKSTNSSAAVDFLVQQLTSTHATSRLAAHLMLAEILRGKKDHVLALEVLSAIEATLAALPRPSTQQDDPSSLLETLRFIIVRLDSADALAHATANLFDAMTKVTRPAYAVQWLADDRQTSTYARFASKIYAIANSTFLRASLATDLLRSLLTQLGSDALLFFASVWSAPAPSTTPYLRIAALKHAAAFLRAHASTKDKADFQLILPALLLALKDEDKEVRTAAVSVLQVVATVKESEDVYALDTIYGERSSQVQLMKPAFLEKYLSSLLASSSELIMDPARLTTLHASILGHVGGHNKKDTGIKRAMLSSLVSQLVAWQSMHARLGLLETLSSVHDAAVLKGVIPIWSGLVIGDSDESQWLAGHSQREQDAFLKVLGKTLDKGSGTALVNVEGESWRYFLGLLSSAPASRFGSRIRLLAQERIASGVFDILPPAQQIPYVSALVQSLHDVTSDEALSSTAILKKLNLASEVLIQLLTDLSQPLESAGAAIRKKQRHEDAVDVDRADVAVLDLTVLVESRVWKKVPAHAGLVASLLNIQSSLLAKKGTVKEGADYLEQEVLGAILALLERIREPAEVAKFHIGIEPIIKSIRSTTNPRTSQRALLVAAELARLIPDAVLHNVMPIFTFMGSADLQRDDAYTFGVVEKTVKSIVPVLISSLRETAASTGLDLWNAASAFISIFTDMAARLPKHRTLPFFVHLVESLGAQEFLAPVSWLLIDRATAKTAKSAGSAGLEQAIELALGVANSAGRHARLVTLKETVGEAGRLMADLPNAEKSAFLSQFLKETDDANRTLRQITALFNYSTGVATSLVGKPADQDIVKTIVENLVGLLALTRTPGMQGTDVQVSLQRTLGEVMKLLSADNFLAVVVSVLASADVSNATIALDLFTERLPLVKRDIRTKASTAISAIVRKAADLIATTAAVPALAAVRAVTVSALSGEDAALAFVAPKLVANAKGQTEMRVLSEELSLLDMLARHLGPRIIPAIQPALGMLLGLIGAAGTSTNIVKASFSTLTALIETVPTFISASQLSTVLLATIQARVKAEESSTAMISVCTRKILTRTMFPVVMELWKQAQKLDETAMEAYFHLLRLTLKNADRAVLPTLLKTIFNFFLDVFDLRHRLQAAGTFDLDVVNRVEESAIGSFLELVTKLSEASFKPLFTRLYDWAVIDLADASGEIGDKRLNERKTVLLHVMMGLLTKFKSLLSPYIGTLLPHIEELLPAYADGEATDPELWTLLVRVLGKSFEVDEGAFWTEALYLKLIPLLTAQIGVFPDRTRLSTSEALPYTLGAMAASTTSEASLKALNTRICMATREEDVNVRLAALRVMEAVWERQAEEMVGLVPETVSEYLAELLEDENADVEAMARGVLGKIEKVTGSLQEYLE